MLLEMQRQMATALLSGNTVPLSGLFGSDRISWQQRFAVHQGTFNSFLVDVLAAAYPVVCRLVGERFFRAAAGLYVKQDPPAEAQLWAYGGGFPSFIDGFAPARSLPYLGDVARVEWAWLQAYFAADADPLDPGELAELPPDAVGGLRFDSHPSVRLLHLDHPGHAVWRAHQDPSGRVEPVNLSSGPERVLISRQQALVHSIPIDPAPYAFLEALMGGATLTEAAGRLAKLDPEADLQAVLVNLLSISVFKSWKIVQ